MSPVSPERVSVRAPEAKACVVVRVRVRRGAVVRAGQPLLEWREIESPARPPGGAPTPATPLRAPKPGAVAEVLVKEGDRLQPGQLIMQIEACSHPTVMKDMCADCGADLRSDDAIQTNIAVVPMVHSIPELKVSEELAQKIGKEDSDRLLRDRKLVLLVDLDQTLIHTTNDNVPSNLKDVHHFQLKSWGPGGSRWYHTRFRPGTLDFLKTVANMYELHICTFGARAYAHRVAEFLDPRGELFSHRILSRDECFDIHTKTPNLRALFPCGDNLVCIIDDREDVWNRAANLIQVKPYHFFEHTGDINAPPGLEKTERDIEGQGVHLEDLEIKKEVKVETQTIRNSTEMPLLDVDKAGEAESVKKSTEKVEKGEQVILVKENKVVIEKSERVILENDNKMSVEKDNKVTLENDDKVLFEKSDKVLLENDMEVDENKPITVPESQIEPVSENTIVKDIEKIVSRVQENFISNEAVKDGNGKIDDVPQTDKNDELIEGARTKWKMTENGMIDVEDADDYLLYLEEILERIHKLFYEHYDRMKAGLVPDLKVVIPQVKSQVLAGTSLVFSGLVPTHQKLEHSRAFMVAQSLGAEVTQDFTERTTHLVAVRPGTAKVHACRKIASTNGGKRPHTVTPAWLWCCAERWQHVEERVFPLRGNTRLIRRPPPHCGSPPRLPISNTIAPRKRTPSGRFMDTINPLLSFSSDDIANMDKEVEDMINESEESDSDNKTSNNGNAGDDRLTDFSADDNSQTNILKQDLCNISSGSDDSVESLSGDYPHGWKPEVIRKRRRSDSLSGDANSEITPPKQICDTDLKFVEDSTQDPSDEEFPSEKFKRGGSLPSDGPDQNESDTNGSSDPPDDIDDGEWNMMGAALEREFLGLDK